MEEVSRARAYCEENTAMPYENHGCECLLQKVYLAFRIANARTRTAPEITHHDHAPDDTAAPSATTGGATVGGHFDCTTRDAGGGWQAAHTH